MIPLFDLVGHVTQHNVDEVTRAKAFVGAQRSRQGHTDRHRAVEDFSRLVAQITVTAGGGIFAEVF